MNNKKSIKPALIVVAIIFTLLSIWVCILALSEILTVRPQKTLIQLNKGNNVEQELTIKMIDRLKFSISLNSHSANSHLLLAQFYNHLYQLKTENSEINYSELAEQEFKEATYLQPTWELAWANLTQFYYQNNDITKMLAALENSLSLGPFEDETQKIIIPIIFTHWDLINNSNTNKIKIMKVLKHIFRFKKNQYLTFKLALESKNIQIIKIVESLIPNNKYKEQLQQRLKEIDSKAVKPQSKIDKVPTSE